MVLGLVFIGHVARLSMVTGVKWWYKLTEKQRASTIRNRKMDSCTRLSINILELLGTVMDAYYMITVVRRDGPEREGKSMLMLGDTMLAVHWVQECKRGADAVGTGGLMKLLGVLEGRSWWCFQVMHIKGAERTLANGLTKYVPMIPLRRWFHVGMMLGTRRWDSGYEPHYTIKNI